MISERLPIVKKEENKENNVFEQPQMDENEYKDVYRMLEEMAGIV